MSTDESPAERLARDLKVQPGRRLGVKRSTYAVWASTLRDHRKRLGLTVQQVAQATGEPASTLYTLEGGSDPRLSTALRLAAFFAVELAVLWPAQNSEGLRS